MTLKHVLKIFSKTEVQEDRTHPTYLSQTILNRLFGRVLEMEGGFNVPSLFKGRLGWVSCLAPRQNKTHPNPPLEREGVSISCAKHTEKNLFTYLPIHIFTSKKAAFTLAEVLITLAIIGLVAALTLPSIITDYQKKVTIKKLKTTYNILNNAIEMAKTEYGTDVNSWDMPDTNDSKILSDYFAEHYMLSYLKVVQDCKNISVCRFYGYPTQREFVLSNGSIVVVSVTGVGKNVQNVRTQISIYINGKVKNINYARDQFLVELSSGNGALGHNKNKFWPYGYGSSNCEIHKNIDNTACNKTSTYKTRCFALIMCEGWKIPKDYPW